MAVSWGQRKVLGRRYSYDPALAYELARLQNEYNLAPGREARGMQASQFEQSQAQQAGQFTQSQAQQAGQYGSSLTQQASQFGKSQAQQESQYARSLETSRENQIAAQEQWQKGYELSLANAATAQEQYVKNLKLATDQYDLAVAKAKTDEEIQKATLKYQIQRDELNRQAQEEAAKQQAQSQMYSTLGTVAGTGLLAYTLAPKAAIGGGAVGSSGSGLGFLSGGAGTVAGAEAGGGMAGGATLGTGALGAEAGAGAGGATLGAGAGAGAGVEAGAGMGVGAGGGAGAATAGIAGLYALGGAAVAHQFMPRLGEWLGAQSPHDYETNPDRGWYTPMANVTKYEWDRPVEALSETYLGFKMDPTVGAILNPGSWVARSLGLGGGGGGTWICTEIKRYVGMTHEERSTMRKLRRYTKQNCLGWLNAYNQKGPILIEAIKSKESNLRGFYEELKESFFKPCAELVKGGYLDKAFGFYKDETIKLFKKYAPGVKIEEVI